MITEFTKDNFYKYTNADFTRCDIPTREPDYMSESGSMYWYYDNFVVRCSDHWGNGINSCDWSLDGGAWGYGMHPVVINPDRSYYYADGVTREQITAETGVKVAGVALWSDFSDNEKYKDVFYVDANDLRIPSESM